MGQAERQDRIEELREALALKGKLQVQPNVVQGLEKTKSDKGEAAGEQQVKAQAQQILSSDISSGTRTDSRGNSELIVAKPFTVAHLQQQDVETIAMAMRKHQAERYIQVFQLPSTPFSRF